MCTPFRRSYCARHIADTIKIRCLAVAHAFDLLMYLHHLGLAEPRRLADRQRVDIHLRQGLHLDSEPDGLFECLGRHDQAMMAEQAGIAAFKRLDGMIRERLRAETGIGGTADIIATRNRDHVVEAWDGSLVDGEDRAEGGMRVEHDIHIVSRLQNIAMETPFG